MPLILPGNVGSATAATGFDVANSCRFGVNTYMHKVLGSDNEKDTWTFSLWVKRGKSGSTQRMMTHNGATSGKFFYLRWESNEQLHFHIGMSDGNFAAFDTTQVFRDHSAWYHIVCAVDTTQGTEANRVKIYVNGSQVTAFGTSNYPAQNTTALLGNTSTPLVVGGLYGSGFGITSGSPQEFYDGYLAEVCFIDDAQLAADSFGEFDSDSGIWKPKNVSGLTFGTDGFYLDFQASGNLGNDANGGTDLTEVNLAAADQSTDTCTNNFATLNPLNNYWAAATFSEGNSVYTSNNSSEYYGIATSTIGVSKGKWYFEAKTSTSSDQDILGITSRNQTGRGTWLGSRSQEYGYYQDTGEIRSSASDTSYGQTYTVNDIIGIYMDLDNNKMYVSDNGSLMNSGTGHTITAAALTDSGFYHFAVGDNSDNTQVWQCNFGGTSGFAISSAVTDDNGFGAFEYSPNITGDSVAKKFYALCSKNLAEFG